MWEEVPPRNKVPEWPVQAQQVPSRQDQVQPQLFGKLQTLMACERNDTRTGHYYWSIINWQLASALPPMHLPIKLLAQMVIQTTMGICKGQALSLVRWLALADLKASAVTGLKALFLAGTTIRVVIRCLRRGVYA
jgi:hypothetical protein